MGWSNLEEQTKKKGMETSSKVLLGIIACLILIILLIIVLLLNVQTNTFKLTIDGIAKESSTINSLITKVNNKTYIQIEGFSKLVGYEYHKGEYKAFTMEEDKCYVQGANETASFFLNDNRVCKLPVKDLESDYREFTFEDTIKDINGKMYATIDAISLGFNVSITEGTNSLTIFTLDYLVSWYNNKVKQWGYTGITDQNFENQKAILYGYLIVKKDAGLYKIINNENTKELVSDKYNSIQFTENTKEFFVTNSLGQVGIINLDGTTKIEPIYESISILDKESDLYLIQKDKKFGVVKSGNIIIIYPEYDNIGLNTKNISSNIESKYVLLDTLIPVCKNNKWGAFNKEGKEIYKAEYDEFGCNIITVEIEGNKKSVGPLIYIEECKGIVVKKEDKYGLIDVNGRELVPVQVDGIYSLENTDGKKEYFMKYNGKELNVIERLVIAGLIEDPNEKETTEENNTNMISNDIAINNQSTNITSNNNIQ